MTRKRNYTPLIWTLTLVINLLVAVLFFLPNKDFYKTYDFSMLPLLNALLNFSTFISLCIALSYIKKKNIKMHRAFVLLAFVLTSGFLLSYLLYHYTTPSTHYGGEGVLKYVYYLILITHIVLAAIIVPLALFSMGYGLNGEVAKHRRVARWTMPIWLYVSLTGVIVYVMLMPYYHTAS